MRRSCTTSTTSTGKAPGKSAKSQVTVAPVSSRPLAPPVVKYCESWSGSATASNTSCTGRAMRPATVNRKSMGHDISSGPANML